MKRLIYRKGDSIMFIIICNILYYIGIIVAGIAMLLIIARAANAFEFEFITKKQIMKANGIIDN